MPTVQVKIAVAVDRDGKWNCCGASGMDEDDMMGLAIDTVEPGERRYWLTADLQIPVGGNATTVAADVSPGDNQP
jgi:hypothetical protein